MMERILAKIDRLTEDHPRRWREILRKTLLEGSFPSEAHRLAESALALHSSPPADLEPAEAILAGDAFLSMAMAEPPSAQDLRKFILWAVSRFDR